jgi:hypothetical protein
MKVLDAPSFITNHTYWESNDQPLTPTIKKPFHHNKHIDTLQKMRKKMEWTSFSPFGKFETATIKLGIFQAQNSNN